MIKTNSKHFNRHSFIPVYIHICLHCWRSNFLRGKYTHVHIITQIYISSSTHAYFQILIHSHTQSQNSLTDCTLIYTHTHTHTHNTHIHTFSWIIITFVYIYYNLHVSTHIKFPDTKVCSTVILKRTAIIPSVREGVQLQDLKYRQKRLHSLLLF